MNKVLLDTNAYSTLLTGDKMVLNELENADIIHFSVIVIGELLTGFKGGSKEKKNITTLVEFINKPKIKIIDVTINTASIFAGIKNYLKKKGNPIPINDVWISAQTFESQSKLITYDKHFHKIPKIDVWEKARQ